MPFMLMNKMQVLQQGRDNKVILMLRAKIWQIQAFMEELEYQIQNRSSQLKNSPDFIVFYIRPHVI